MDKSDLIFSIAGLAITTLGTFFSLRGYLRGVPRKSLISDAKLQELRSSISLTIIDLCCESLANFSRVYLRLDPDVRLRREFELLMSKPDVVRSLQELFLLVKQCGFYNRRHHLYCCLQVISGTVLAVSGVGVLLPWLKMIAGTSWAFGPINWVTTTVALQSAIGIIYLGLERSRTRREIRSCLEYSGVSI